MHNPYPVNERHLLATEPSSRPAIKKLLAATGSLQKSMIMGTVALNTFHDLFCSILEEDATIVSLYKSKDRKSDYSNYRGISRLCCWQDLGARRLQSPDFQHFREDPTRSKVSPVRTET